jgi:hypothetical protein
MDLENNNQERIYDNKYSKWRKKWYPKIGVWYFIFFVICVIVLFLYKKEITDNKEILIFIPFINWIISFLFIQISTAICNKPDYDYIERYYPEISKKIWIMGRDNGIMDRTAFNELYTIEYGTDPIIDEIVEYKEKFIPLLIIPFIFAVINAIILEFIL